MSHAQKNWKFRSLLQAELTSGKFLIGDKILSEFQLVKKYGLSRTTIRETIVGMVQDGILEKMRGSGTYVKSLSPVSRSQTIAVFVPCIRHSHGVYGSIIRGIEDKLHEKGYSLILCNHDNTPSKAQSYLETAWKNNVAGILYVPIEVEDYQSVNVGFLKQLENTYLPFVLVDKTISGDGYGRYSYVGADGFEGMRLAVRHLYKLGHTRIALIGHQIYYTMLQRHQGFCEEIARLKLELPDGYLQDVDMHTDEPGRKEVRNLLAMKNPPSAVVCSNDDIAMIVLNELRRMNVLVPRELAIVGFDDLPQSQHMYPSLTTVHQPLVEEGRKAVELLLGKIEGLFSGQRQEFLPCTLMVRKSCGAPKEMQTPSVKSENVVLVSAKAM